MLGIVERIVGAGDVAGGRRQQREQPTVRVVNEVGYPLLDGGYGFYHPRLAA